MLAIPLFGTAGVMTESGHPQPVQRTPPLPAAHHRFRALLPTTQCSHVPQPTDLFHPPSILPERPFHLGARLVDVLPKGSARLRVGRARRCAPWCLGILVQSTRRVANGSRRSPRVPWGGDLRATVQERACTPTGVPDSLPPRLLEIASEPITCCEICRPGGSERWAARASYLWVWHPLRGA
jgi:hypothetical protein